MVRENDYSIECAAEWGMEGYKAETLGWGDVWVWGWGNGGQTRQRTKMGNPLKV